MEESKEEVDIDDILFEYVIDAFRGDPAKATIYLCCLPPKRRIGAIATLYMKLNNFDALAGIGGVTFNLATRMGQSLSQILSAEEEA